MRDPLPGIRNGAVITVGTFDGVHRGHRDILTRLADRARATGLPSVVVTFRPHPLAVLSETGPPLLLTPGDEQLDALAQADAPDYVIALPFTRTLAGYSASRFIREALMERYALRELVIGHDHGLGRGREGDAAALRAIGAELGFPVDVVPPTTSPEGVPVSSSTIRRAVAEGKLDTAAQGLGRQYAFRGTVVSGSQRGRELGFPTVNLALLPPEKLLPPLGVYAVRVTFAAGTFGGMLNLGGRPTFGDLALSPEVHLFDVAGEWYGQSLCVEFVTWLRDTVRFSGVEALKDQLTQDAAAARNALTQL